MGIGAIDVDLREHGELNLVVVLGEVVDLFFFCGFLCAELVAGEGQDLKAFGLKIRVDLR